MVEFNKILNLVAIESIVEIERIFMLKGLTYFLHCTVRRMQTSSVSKTDMSFTIFISTDV